jgi:hypothetical protein
VAVGPSDGTGAPQLKLTRADAVVLLLLASLACAVWGWVACSTRISLEDAYITFRYARNIVQGNGFVYNIGERVLGTTSPLQTVLLALLGEITGPDTIPAVASVLMPLFGVAAGALAYLALVALGVRRAGAALGAALLYLHPLVLKMSLSGLETPLVLFLMASSLYFVSRRRPMAAAIAVALLTLARVDGLIWGGILGATALLTRRSRPLRAVVAFLAVIAPWLVFSWLYFGSILPNSMLAKGVVRPGREHLLTDAVYFSRLSRFYLSGLVLGTTGPLLVLSLGLLTLGILAIAGRHRRELLVLPVFPAVYAFLMYVGRAPRFQWYLAPMLFCSLLLMGVGLGHALGWVSASGRRRFPGLLAAAAIAAVAVPALFQAIGAIPRQVERMRLVQRNELSLRRGVGEWLHDNTPRLASVAMEAIGYQGYYADRRVIDMAGLVSPRVVEMNASTGSNALVFKRIARELKPDFIVLRSFEVDENRHFKGGKLFDTPADRDWFFRHYREVKRFDAPYPRLAPLLSHLSVYQRAGAGDSP